MNTVQDAIDKIRDTAYSHERCSVLEVMGRKAGYIALNGISGGAEAVILPEKFDIDKDIIKPIMEGRNRGKSIISLSLLRVSAAVEVAQYIEEKRTLNQGQPFLTYTARWKPDGI